MVVTEQYEDREDLVLTYSDRGMMIRQEGTGDLYPEAVDPIDMHISYTETYIPVDQEIEE